jgi:hypothetical protein
MPALCRADKAALSFEENWILSSWWLNDKSKKGLHSATSVFNDANLMKSGIKSKATVRAQQVL